ncbi:hypothetical protein FRC03_011650, partial [Tulasnella sp. 419]
LPTRDPISTAPSPLATPTNFDPDSRAHNPIHSKPTAMRRRSGKQVREYHPMNIIMQNIDSPLAQAPVYGSTAMSP